MASSHSLRETHVTKIIDSHLHVWASPQQVYHHLFTIIFIPFFFFFFFSCMAKTFLINFFFFFLFCPFFLANRRRINTLTFREMNPLYLAMSISCSRYFFPSFLCLFAFFLIKLFVISKMKFDHCNFSFIFQFL